MKINFFNQYTDSVRSYEKVIKNVFNKIESKKTFNLIFVTNDEIKRINNEFRHIDKVTDVISFANCDDPDQDLLDTELGDIFIAVDRALEQANEYGHSAEREFAFLTVHGYLHLCGYDHQTLEEEKEMFDLQEEILTKAGYKR